MNKYRIKTKRDFIEGLGEAINLLLKKESPEDDDDKIFFALLIEIKEKLYDKQKNVKNEYSLSLTPAQALALSVMKQNYFPSNTSYIGNMLHKISREVTQQYSTPF